ncbi:hypothetical protein QVD17_37938 [Tagetes erecta]|uniref:Transposase, Ptta/En/Spm, plant n=1 Tax=Tagetes erecta TaxID=13708 RepID=A0AAD8ND51_TARER|nr:hypothetical protein QVD17_37938 [Tagetes erecta]
MSGSRGGTHGRTPYSGGRLEARSGGRSGAIAGSKLPHESSPSSNDVSTRKMFTSGGDMTRGGGISGGQASHESSPGCSDATTRQKFTCAGRILFRGGDVSHGGSTGRGCVGLGDVDGVPSQIGYNQRLNAIIDDGYNHEDIESGDDNEGEDAGDNTDHPSQRDSNYEEGVRGTSQRKRVSRIGDKFASFEVHQSISRILWEHLTGVWPTFRKMSSHKVASMYDRFKTRCDCGDENDQNVYEGFINKRKLGREPQYREICLDTHLTKESKQKFWAGELDLHDLDRMEFTAGRSKEVYGDYLQAMTKKYGANFTNDDHDVYLGLQEGGSSRRIYGIGSSDLNYMITGIPSSSYGIAPSYIEYRKSQERVEKLEARIEEMQQVEETTRKQLEEFMKNWQSQANI